MDRLTRAELESATQLVWLLRVTFAGRDYYWSTSPCSPVDDDGVALPHDGGLPSDLVVEVAMSGLGQEPVAAATPVEVWWPQDDPVAALIEAGHDPNGAEAELALWAEGETYAARTVYIRGPVEGFTYRGASDPVAFEVTQRQWEGATLVPAPAAVATTTTWSGVLDADVGKVYPEVVGYPGQWDREPSATTSGSPSILVDTGVARTILIAGHHVNASDVIVFDSTTSETLSVTNTTDALNRKVATVDLVGAVTIDNTQTEFWIGWTQANGGGRMNADRSTMAGAGDVLVHYLQAGGRKVDLGEWQTVAPELNAIQVGGYWQERVDPWEVMRDHVVPLLPVELVSGPDGIRPVLWRFSATADDAVEWITDGDNAEVVEGPYYSKRADVVNRQTLRYAFRAKEAESRRVTTVAGDPDPSDPDEFYSLAADQSQRRYTLTPGERYVSEGSEETSEWLWLETDAQWVVTWWVECKALLTRSLTLSCAPVLGWLDVGSVVALTSARLSMTNRVALVRVVRWIGVQTVELDLTLTERPARDARA